MTYKNKWLSILDMVELYDNVSEKSLQSIAHNATARGVDIKEWYKTDGRRIYVNAGYLEHIWNRRRHIQFEAQDMYYKIVDVLMPVPKLTHMLADRLNVTYHGATDFLRNGLWTNYYFTSLTTINISPRLIMFHRLCSEILEPISFDSIEEEYDYNEAKRILKCVKKIEKE